MSYKPKAAEGLYTYLIDLFKNKHYLVLLVVGLFLSEAILSLWTESQYDMKIWFQTGVWMNQGTNIYLPADHLGYPPLWAFWCLVSYRAFGILENNVEMWRFVIKLPLILAQFALAFAIAKFAQTRFDRKTAQNIFLLTLTWIFFIFISAMWGQLNMLSALLTFLAFYAVTTKKNTLGAVFLGLAVTLKIYPLIILPAFLAYIQKNQNPKETGKFAFYTCAIPIVFTFAVFTVYQWDILYFLRTIFYWSPVFETANPTLIQGGAMNLWSFVSLLTVDISQVWMLRFLWIPVIGAAAIYWFKKKSMEDADLNLAIISFYLLFMLSYAWVPEQSFLDPLPFIFLHILAYNPKKLYLYTLVGVQLAVFAFSTFNWGPFIFIPLVQKFSPPILAAIQVMNPKYPLIWTTRGVLGLVVSVSIGLLLMALAKPEVFEVISRKIFKKPKKLP